jgi:hypothetical protein
MALKEENCEWQALMDVCYDRWQKHDKQVREDYEAKRIDDRTARKRMWGVKDMLIHACNSKAERAACVFGKLNQQIENGGVIQWVDNGYAMGCIDYLQEFLEETGPVGKRVWAMLSPFLEDFMDEDTGEIRQYGEDADAEWSEAFECSDGLSTRFYAIQDEWHPEVYAYLAKLQGEPVAAS